MRHSGRVTFSHLELHDIYVLRGNINIFAFWCAVALRLLIVLMAAVCMQQL